MATEPNKAEAPVDVNTALAAVDALYDVVWHDDSTVRERIDAKIALKRQIIALAAQPNLSTSPTTCAENGESYVRPLTTEEHQVLRAAVSDSAEVVAPSRLADSTAAAAEGVSETPFAYWVYVPAEQRGEFVHQLDEATDDLTNCECEVTKLYDRPASGEDKEAELIEVALAYASELDADARPSGAVIRTGLVPLMRAALASKGAHHGK